MDARPDADPGTDDPDDPLSAVLTLMRLSRALERVDSGLSPQQYRILKLAGSGGERSARLAEWLAVARPTLTGDGARIRAGLALVSSALEELRCARGSTGTGPVSYGRAAHPQVEAARPGRA